MADDIKPAPPPWVLKGDVYLFPFWTNPSDIAKANEAGIMYSPLEGKSSYASAESGKPIGGMGMVQIIRYRESPVGPYDELIVVPGSFEYDVEEKGKRVKKRNIRISRIYVSQKYTCWNGRKNWNIPKHLAKFDFKEDKDGFHVKVFPHDNTGDVTEAAANTVPFFKASFKSIPWVPSFPYSFAILKYTGMDLNLVHPPNPQGEGSQGELAGTDRWCSVVPGLSSRSTSIGWFDLKQSEEDGTSHAQFENFWPGLKRWHFGMRMKDTTIDFPGGKYWDPPKSLL